jgi:hypothetical protein
MSLAMSNSTLLDDLGEYEESWKERFDDWVRTELVYYAGSFTFHLLALSLLLLMGNVAAKTIMSDQVVIESSRIDEPVGDPPKIEITPAVSHDDPAVEPEIDPQAKLGDDQGFTRIETGPVSATPDNGGSIASAGKFGEDGSGMPNIFKGTGARIPLGMIRPGRPMTGGGGGGGTGIYNHNHHFGPRGDHIGPGQTNRTEQAVRMAIDWLVRHQSADGSWSLKNYKQRCYDATCTGPGTVDSDAAATAMGLLPFLAHGETHKTHGGHERVVANGLLWLMRHQKPDGDLSAGSSQQMYTHGLATIALCEAYGMTGDRQVGGAAQSAVQFIQSAQNKETGGWRYHPGEDGDTSVVGWQIMALKSAQMAGLNVGKSNFDWAGKFLDSVAKGYHGGQFAYQPGQETTPTMTSVGLLCRQYLGAKRNDPVMSDGTEYLLSHLPDAGMHNLYYWYYATQVMHNINGPEWDAWNRKMRKILVETQNVDSRSCARGSWDPSNPAKDQWGGQGGRLMMTSLSALTLEIYYRYLPLYTMERHRDAPVGH